jgi:hypothetical protein
VKSPSIQVEVLTTDGEKRGTIQETRYMNYALSYRIPTRSMFTLCPGSDVVRGLRTNGWLLGLLRGL